MTLSTFVGSCFLAILILGCTIRIKRQIRESQAKILSTDFYDAHQIFQAAQAVSQQIYNQGARIMSTVSQGVADVQAAIGTLKDQVSQLQSNQQKASEAITKEIARVNATIASLSGNPGDAQAIAQALTDLNQVNSNLSAVNASLQAGTAQLDAEDPDPAPTTPPDGGQPAPEEPAPSA